MHRLILIFTVLLMPLNVFAISGSTELYYRRGGIHFYDPEEGSSLCGPNFSGENNAQISFNYFLSKELTKEQSAGIVGNLQQESGINPESIQPGGDGRGIAQWDKDDRWINLQKFATAQDRDFLTLELQLEYIWFELTGEPPTPEATGGSEAAAFEALVATQTLAEATRVFVEEYERAGQPELEKRIEYAQQVLDSYGDASPSGTCSAGVGGVEVFPLVATKSIITTGAQGATWCYQSEDNCHHHYNAADIHAVPGTQVVAAKAGRVASATESVGGVGSRVTILGDDGQYTYYYTHMAFGSLTVAEGDQITSGQNIGLVGDSAQAVDTAPHLHFDALPQQQYDYRPSCSGADCVQYPFVNVQPLLKQLYDTVVPNQ